MIDWIIHTATSLGIEPMTLAGFGIALLASWAGTQAIKKVFRFGGRCCIIIAFCIGFGAAYTIAPGWGAVPFWIAFLAGSAAPLTYKGAVMVLHHRYPKAAAMLSGDLPKPDEHEEVT